MKQLGILKVEQVDTTLYMSWINKMFVFKGQPLGEIMGNLVALVQLGLYVRF